MVDIFISSSSLIEIYILYFQHVVITGACKQDFVKKQEGKRGQNEATD
jgi:hypothetical protein